MNHLMRSHAPITDIAWRQLDSEGRERLVPALGGRKLVDFSGPLGWGHSATNLGRVSDIKPPGENLQARQRRVLPLVELRAPFSISRHELHDADRGATDLDLTGLDGAARTIAVAENLAVFHGWPEAGIVGIADATSHVPITLGADFARYPGHVAKAVETLLKPVSAGPTAWRSARSSTPASWRRPSTAVLSCSTTCARSSAAPSCGPRESRVPWSSA